MKRNLAGGQLWMEEQEQLQLRVFVDASAVEVFTGTGQVLSTRVYRGAQPKVGHTYNINRSGNNNTNKPEAVSVRDMNAGCSAPDVAPTGDITATPPSGLKVRMLSGACVFDRLEVHATRAAWIRACDMPLPPPVSSGAVQAWKDAGFPVRYMDQDMDVDKRQHGVHD